MYLQLALCLLALSVFAAPEAAAACIHNNANHPVLLYDIHIISTETHTCTVHHPTCLLLNTLPHTHQNNTTSRRHSWSLPQPTSSTWPAPPSVVSQLRWPRSWAYLAWASVVRCGGDCSKKEEEGRGG